MTPFITLEDSMGRRTDALSPPNCCLVVMLSAGVPKKVVVPHGATVMLASCTGLFWVRYGGSATLPVADILDGTAPELNPAARSVAGLSSLGLIAPADCILNLCFYR